MDRNEALKSIGEIEQQATRLALGLRRKADGEQDVNKATALRVEAVSCEHILDLLPVMRETVKKELV
jgi:hypothetical protein